MGDRAFRPSRDLRSTTAMKLRSERPHVEMSGKGRGERKALGLKDVPPTFLVSVAAKGFSPAVSLLFATLAGRCISVADKGVSSAVSLLFATLAARSISVAAKGLTGADCWRESNWVGG